jgi:hypothetical protein
LERKVRRLLREQRDRRDPAGALAPRRLTARPAESEAPGAEINHFSNNKNVYEKSLKKKEADFVNLHPAFFYAKNNI